MLEDLEREDPPLVERLAQPHGDMQRRPWPADRTCLEVPFLTPVPGSPVLESHSMTGAEAKSRPSSQADGLMSAGTRPSHEVSPATARITTPKSVQWNTVRAGGVGQALIARLWRATRNALIPLGAHGDNECGAPTCAALVPCAAAPQHNAPRRPGSGCGASEPDGYRSSASHSSGQTPRRSHPREEQRTLGSVRGLPEPARRRSVPPAKSRSDREAVDNPSSRADLRRTHQCPPERWTPLTRMPLTAAYESA